MASDKYAIGDISLQNVRNRHEVRVVEAMRNMLPEVDGFCGCRICIEDVYALAMNELPPHYVQSSAIVLVKAPPSEQDISRAVADGIGKVRVRPNHPE